MNYFAYFRISSHHSPYDTTAHYYSVNLTLIFPSISLIAVFLVLYPVSHLGALIYVLSLHLCSAQEYLLCVLSHHFRSIFSITHIPPRSIWIITVLEYP